MSANVYKRKTREQRETLRATFDRLTEQFEEQRDTFGLTSEKDEPSPRLLLPRFVRSSNLVVNLDAIEAITLVGGKVRFIAKSGGVVGTIDDPDEAQVFWSFFRNLSDVADVAARRITDQPCFGEIAASSSEATARRSSEGSRFSMT